MCVCVCVCVCVCMYVCMYVYSLRMYDVQLMYLYHHNPSSWTAHTGAGGQQAWTGPGPSLHSYASPRPERTEGALSGPGDQGRR